MRAIRLSWLIILLAGMLIGGLAVGAIWFAQDRAEQDGRIVDAGSYEEFVRAGAFPPALFVRDDFYLVQAEAGELMAL